MVKEFDPEIKSKMPEGIWQEEPDYQHWIDEETGLDCLIVRNNGGALCGYVGVPHNHPFYGFKYGDCILPTASKPTEEEKQKYKEEQIDFTVNHLGYTREKAEKAIGILTKYFDEKIKCSEEYCSHTIESILSVHGGITYSNMCQGKICHKTDDGDHVWWIGFDCAHSGDYCPAYDYEWTRDGEYRNVEYVMSECKDLAKQLLTVWEAKLTE